MIKILSVKPMNKDSLQAIVDVKITNWSNAIIREITVWKKDTGSRWINFPTRSFEGKDGKKAYKTLLGFDDDPEVKPAFEKEFFKVYDEFVKTQPVEPVVDTATWGQGKACNGDQGLP